jgi:hypothetical protein
MITPANPDNFVQLLQYYFAERLATLVGFINFYNRKAKTTTALVSTKPLTDTSTRNIFWMGGVRAAGAYG